MAVERIKGAPRILSGGPQRAKIKVAAYCRVSTDSEDQMNSYNSQKEHYYNLITSTKEYEFVGIYADPGITGTNAEKREEFQRLIADAKEGKIDLILTKSISRFARNTLDTLKYVRDLKTHNVSVKFEEENINTISMDGELLLTILSSVAQQEVQNISANVKKGLEMKMQRGELVGSHRCLGYDYDSKTKTISVNQEEAKIVKYIFKRYLEGYGVRTIGRELAKLGYKTIKGSASWSDGTILDLIKNVKYKGDLIQGRTYTVDPISKRRIPNDGTTDMFYIKDHHEAIISPEDFDKAQELNKMKRDAFGHRKTKEETDIIYHRLYAFTGICYCSYCGSRMFRRKTTAIKNSKFVWHCTNHVRNGKSYCPDSRAIDEAALEKAFVESFNQLIENKISNVDDFIVDISEGLEQKEYAVELKKIQSEIQKLEKKKNNLLELRMEDLISKDELASKLVGLNDEIANLRKEETAVSKLDNTKNTFKEKANEFKQALQANQLLEGFDRTIFESTIERVIIGSYDDNNAITFVFKMDYSSGERIFDNPDNRYSARYNHVTPFIVDSDEDRERTLKYIFENTSELFNFNMEYPHYIFLPDGNGALNKILKKSVPVKVLISNK